MLRTLKFLVLTVFCIGLMLGMANAQGFLVKFIDANGDGQINFVVNAFSFASQNYYLGVGTPNTYTSSSQLLTIPAATYNPTTGVLTPGYNAANVSWTGTSLLYDVYLSDGAKYYWTSLGTASGASTGSSLTIEWFSASAIPVFTYSISTTGDAFQVVPVPISSSIWLMGFGLLGILAFCVVRRRLVTCN